MPKPKFRYMTVHGTSLIKVQCVEYQWICHDKLYKLMANFFKTSNLFELLAENQRIFKRITRLGLCNLGWEGICVDHWSALVLVMLAPLFNRGGILFSSSQTNFQACHTTHTYIIWTVIDSTFRNWFSLVCTTFFKWIAELHFYPISLMFYIIGFFLMVSTN